MQPVMDRLPRKLTSVTIGVVAFVGSYLFLFPSGCDDIGGVSSWERCITAIGTPAFSLTDWGLDNKFDILIPLVVGVLAGVVTRWLLGLRNSDRT
jgi:NhaP-type Na+/H+ or K+/H+ antiporter